MATLRYEISFKGTASDTLAAAFEDAAVTSRHGVTTVRTALPDRAALEGAIGKIHALGLELLEVRLIADAEVDDLAWIDGP